MSRAHAAASQGSIIISPGPRSTRPAAICSKPGSQLALFMHLLTCNAATVLLSLLLACCYVTTSTILLLVLVLLFYYYITTSTINLLCYYY